MRPTTAAILSLMVLSAATVNAQTITPLRLANGAPLGGTDVVVDRAGNIIVTAGHTILGYNQSGELIFIVGNGIPGDRGDGRSATEAQVHSPSGLAYDTAGNLYFADDMNHRVRKITPDGVISVVAGNGRQGFSGDGGPAKSARLNRPADVAIDADGNIYIADSFNHRIRRVSPDGRIQTIAGRAPRRGELPNGDGGPALQAVLDYPWSLAIDRTGTLFFGQNYGLIRKVTRDGRIERVAGFYDSKTPSYNGDGIPALEARIDSATGLAFDADGNLYLSDLRNSRVRRVRSDGIIETVATSPAWAQDVTFDAAGNLLIASESGLLKVTRPAAITSTLSRQPQSVPVPSLLVPAVNAVLENGCMDKRSNSRIWEFRWSAVPGATGYHLQVVGRAAIKAIVDNQSVATPAYRLRMDGYITEFNRTGWRWRVRARVAGTWGEWSAEQAFDVEPPKSTCP